MIKQVNSKPEMAVFKYQILGPSMSHNYYCAVCRNIVAVIDQNTGALQPCWDCQRRGYELVRGNALFKIIMIILSKA